MSTPIWYNGSFISQDSFFISSQDRGFLLGDGVFETILAIDGKPRHLKAHWERLLQGASLFRIPMPYSFDTILDATQELLANNNLSNQQASLRITLTRGSGPRGLLPPPLSTVQPICLIAAFPYICPQTSVTAVTSQFRIDERSPLTQIKHLGYQLYLLAKLEAQDHHAEEALLFNYAENLATSTCANIFSIIGDQIYTPPLSDGARPGVVREALLSLSKKHGIPIHVQSVSANELSECQSLFLTNSLIGIRPCSQLDGRALNVNHVLIRKLTQLYQEQG